MNLALIPDSNNKHRFLDFLKNKSKELSVIYTTTNKCQFNEEGPFSVCFAVYMNHPHIEKLRRSRFFSQLDKGELSCGIR